MFTHCIWDPYGGFGWVLKEWMSFSSFSRPLQAANTWAPDDLHFFPLQRQTRRQYLWMPLNILQHVSTLYLGPIWRLWMGNEGMDGLLLLFTAIASRKYLCDRDLSTSAPFKDKRVASTFGCR